MDKYLRPTRFDCDPNTVGVDKQWKHWLKTFENFLVAINSHTPDKLVTLTNYIAPNVYEYIVDCATYDEAIEVLKGLYVKPTNEIYSRHLLATRKQEESESLDQYLQVLRRLSKDCNFTAVTALENEQSYIRDAFINGIRSREIRQRLLEKKILTLDQAFKQAPTPEMEQKNSATYSNPDFHTAATDTCQDENIAPPTI